VPLRLPGDAGRGLLRRPGPGQCPAPADAAVRHDEWAATHPRTRGAAAALSGGEVWLQEPQTHWADPLSGRAASRLLGRPRLRLVRRPMTPSAVLPQEKQQSLGMVQTRVTLVQSFVSLDVRTSVPASSQKRAGNGCRPEIVFQQTKGKSYE